MAEMVKLATRESFGKAIAELADQYPDVVVLDADLAAATKTGIFKKAHPAVSYTHIRPGQQWPLESTKRSRSGSDGFFGSTFIS